MVLIEKIHRLEHSLTNRTGKHSGGETSHKIQAGIPESLDTGKRAFLKRGRLALLHYNKEGLKIY